MIELYSDTKTKPTAAMRAAGYLLIHTREGHRPDLADCPPNKLWRSEQIGSSNAALGPAVAGQMLPPEKAHLLVTILGYAGDVESAARPTPCGACPGPSATARR